MAFTKYQVLLSIIMVATGSLNTLSTKWADREQAESADGKTRKFNHPFVQACVMFSGEILCLITFNLLYYYYTRRQVMVENIDYVRGNQNFNPFIFLPAALCDMIATSLMYIGLVMTTAPSFQMLRGSVIVFVAFLSITFLERVISLKQWSGISLIVVGLVIVGASDLSANDNRDTNSVITGNLLVIMAQIITACQMVYEEKFVVEKDIPPLQAIGWEGVFGFMILSTLLVPFYFIKVGYPFADNARGVLEDLPDALVQMSNNFSIVIAVLGNMLSIAFFNFAGISMTKESSAATRMVLDSVRTLFIWMFSLIFGWESFHILQLLGFFVLVLGMAVYYGLIPTIESVSRLQRATPTRDEPIINQSADEP